MCVFLALSFITDRQTADTYPLSLHDALPISAEALAANERFRLQQRRQLFRNVGKGRFEEVTERAGKAFSSEEVGRGAAFGDLEDRKSTRLNSSHSQISYAVFCLKKKTAQPVL